MWSLSVMARLWRWWCGSIQRRVKEWLMRSSMNPGQQMLTTLGTSTNQIPKSIRMVLGSRLSSRPTSPMYSSSPAKATTLSLSVQTTKGKTKSSQCIVWAKPPLKLTSFMAGPFSRKCHSIPRSPRSSFWLSPRLSSTTWRSSQSSKNSLREAVCTRVWTFILKVVT